MSNNNSVHIWLAPITPELHPEIPEFDRWPLSDSERFRYEKLKTTKRKLEFLSGRALIRTADRLLFQTARRIIETSHGPIVEGWPKHVHLSISHDYPVIALAVAHGPIGVDIQYQDPHRGHEHLQQIISPEEYTLFQRGDYKSPSEYFYKLWCMKEAWFKAAPSHQNISVPSINLKDIIKSGYFFETAYFSGYHIAISSHKKHCKIIYNSIPPIDKNKNIFFTPTDIKNIFKY